MQPEQRRVPSLGQQAAEQFVEAILLGCLDSLIRGGKATELNIYRFQLPMDDNRLTCIIKSSIFRYRDTSGLGLWLLLSSSDVFNWGWKHSLDYNPRVCMITFLLREPDRSVLGTACSDGGCV